jgi:hypothetical protein
MKIKRDEKKVVVSFLPKNDGKFRFKIREHNFSFGESFATATKIFNDKVYLEWQIGYDAIVNDTKIKKNKDKAKKITSLTNFSFKGSNQKDKYLYELSEIVYFLYEDNVISNKLVKDLINEIDGYKEFISDKAILIDKNLKEVKINNFSFKETITSLPTFFYYPKTDGTQIEVSIQKQQYATGVQPMVYYSIPITSFSNGEELFGKTYKDVKNNFELVYRIDKSNVSNFIDLIKIFGMCSPAHNFDVLQILNLILNYK